MANLTPGTRKAAPPSQASDRPRVPDTVEDERDTPIMPDSPVIRIPGQRQPAPQHQPWCDPEAHTDDTCYSADTVVGDLKVRLMWAPGEVVVADVATREVVELFTLDELEQRSLAMLTTALIGRGLTPSPSVLAAVTQ